MISSSKLSFCLVCDELYLFNTFFPEEIPIIETETIDITMDNFYDLFEYVKYVYWSYDSFDRPNSASWVINNGWALKDEYSKLFVKIDLMDPPVGEFHLTGPWDNIKVDENDWNNYSVMETIEEMDTTQIIKLSYPMVDKVNEYKIGFFYNGIGDAKEFVVCMNSESADNFKLENVKGTITFRKTN